MHAARMLKLLSAKLYWQKN